MVFRRSRFQISATGFRFRKGRYHRKKIYRCGHNKRAGNWGTCGLQFDDVGAAQRAIDRITRPTEPSIEVWLVAMEGLLMAVRGEPEKALAHLGAQDTGDNPSLRASHRLVHAHIYAARGDEEAATRELELLRHEAGRAGLERVVRPKGPATALAERLLDDGEAQSG